MQIVPTGAALGAEARGIDIRVPFDAATARALLDAWHEHLILIFRDRELSNDEQIAFTANFGTPDYSGSNKFRKAYTGEKLGNLDGSTPPEIAVVSNVLVNGKPIGSLGQPRADLHPFKIVIGIGWIADRRKTRLRRHQKMSQNCRHRHRHRQYLHLLPSH